MEPIVDGLEQEFTGQLTVVRLDANEPENEAVMQILGLRGHPSFAVVDARGNVTARFFGAQTTETLREAMVQVVE